MIRQVCIYCASSRQADPVYQDAAYRLGRLLARNSITIVCGGGAFGSMGRLADAALAEGGRVVGVLPQFMRELEWSHSGLTELISVADLHERKRLMLAGSDAVIALPGGSGTLEELLEAVTMKRLGMYLKPIVLVNTRRFFDPLLELLDRSIAERFMDERHRAMWTVVSDPDRVIEAIESAGPWGEDARDFAAL